MKHVPASNGHGPSEVAPMDLVDDRELTLAFQRGEKGAYQAIHDLYAIRVHSICRRMLGNPDDAQEASQEAFLRMYQALGRFNGRYQLGAWITRITTNVCLDTLRSRARKPQAVTPVSELVDEIHSDEATEPEVCLIRSSESRRVRRVLAGLPPLHRAAIVLRDYEGLSYVEIADVLDISEVQVKALLHRARQGFKRSWLASALLLIPTRVWHRVRRVRITDKEHAVNAAATPQLASAAQTVASCPTVIQQCGQFLSERVATIVTAAAVGTAAAGAVVAAAPPREPVVLEEHVAKVAAEGARDGRREAPHRVAKKDPAPEAPAVDPDPVPEEPSPTEPDPAETPSPTPPPSDGGAKPPTPSPSPTPSYAPFAPVLAFDRATDRSGSAPSSHKSSVDCEAGSFTQALTSDLNDWDSSYPADLGLNVTRAAADLTLTLSVGKEETSYNGGASSVSWSLEDDLMIVSFGGSYSWSGGRDPKDLGLPRYGSFSATVRLDCDTTYVVAEDLVLNTQ